MPNIFTIAPHAPFLKVLAEKLRDGTLVPDWKMDGAFALSDVTIFLPTKRARLALIDELTRQTGGALLLPRIKTLGEEDSDEAAFFDPDFPGPTATHPAARQLALAHLIAAWVAREDPGGRFGFAGAIDHLALGQSLGRLIDDFEIEEADRAKLASIVPDNLAANWQETLKFLSIVLEAWPKHLAEHGLADHARLRRERIDRECDNLGALYGDRPVIAAGSTGSIPATAKLIRAISKLKRGAVVLPGFDTGLDGETLAALRDGNEHRHAHPQYGMVQLLTKFLQVAPKHVVELAGEASPRTQAVRHVLALAEVTENWPGQRNNLSKAASGLALAIAPTQHEEARAIALAAREALGRGKSVGIISPDRDLARRIAHELKRFGIEIEDGAGTPLALSRAARLMRQALLVVTGSWSPVDVAALLSAPSLRLGLNRAEIARLQGLLELVVLRGQSAGGIAGIRQRIAINLKGEADHPLHRLNAVEAAALTDLLDRLESALMPVAAAFENGVAQPSALSKALRDTLTLLRAPEAGEPPALDGEPELLRWFSALEAAPIAPPIRVETAAESLIALMGGESVAPRRSGRSDIAIWGRIEARLQAADFIVAAGLNENTWPGQADPGPWLSRRMRIDAGLEPPERRTGLAAHDFEMALGAGDVLLTAAQRIGTSPADRSRFLQRLEGFFGEALAGEMRERGAKWIALAEAIDRAEIVVPVERPAPSPKAGKRPRKLSVTEVEKLIRDPYSIYARHVLRLRPLDPLGEPPEAALRGTLIHAVLGGFIRERGDVLAADALDRLMARADAAFAALGDLADRTKLWRRRFHRMADEFLAWERARMGIASRHAEIEGRIDFAVGREHLRLHGRADRIDLRTDGQVEIIDFKTGAVPSSRQMSDRLAPQLPVEAMIARAGGFKDIKAAEAAALTYVKLAHGPEALEAKPFRIKDVALAEAIDDHARRLAAQAELFLLSDTHPMYPHLLPPASARYPGDYDHLARLGEWGGAGEAEE